MRIRILLSIVIFATILSNIILASESKRFVVQSILMSGGSVLDEWRIPGKYSPVKAFDGNPLTCFAEGSDINLFSIRVKFNRGGYVDHINLLNGICKSKELFIKNNRIKVLYLHFSLGNRNIAREKILIKDTDKFQMLKLKQRYYLDSIFIVAIGEEYKGTKYNDTCISEIEFYDEGKKIEIENIDELQKSYLKKSNDILIRALSGHSYKFRPVNHVNRVHVIHFSKSGRIKFSHSVFHSNINPDEIMDEFFPFDEWKVKNLKLFLRRISDSKWVQVKYINDVGGGEVDRLIIYHGKNNRKKIELSNGDKIDKRAIRL